MEAFCFACQPVADPAAIVSGPKYRFTLINETVLRYEWAEDGRFEDRASAFAINRNFAPPEFKVTETEDQLDIITEAFHLTYDKKRFSRSGLAVSFSAKVTLWGAEWRFGEAASDNLGGTARTLDEVDGRCDMGNGILSRSGFSTLDDSQTLLFEKDGTVAPRRPGDNIDGYLFSYGLDFKRGMKAFYDVSGRQPVLPRWALGNWWSRYHPYTDVEYLGLMDRFVARHVPLSVAVVDMDWHQVKGDHIPHAGWTGYTWEKSLFPDPEAFGKALHARHLKITLNDHPHSGIHHHEDLYEAMAQALGHDTSNKAPILFDPTNKAFMKAYLDILHRSLEKNTCDFWWIDWQQGPISRVPGLDPLWLLNHFHFRDSVNQNGEDRGLIFSRYAGPGSHRYPVGFSGDTIVTWESLKFQPEFTATASNIGYGWWSHDIGGHMGGFRDDEMATRWIQFGVFSPIFRLHSCFSQWASKEPWSYRKEYCAVMESFMQFRHRLVPYLHSMNAVGGAQPLVRPLYWEYPSRAESYGKPNEYFFGSSLVVAPVVEPRNSNTNMARTDVWVPPGRHVDLFSGVVYDGDREIQMFRALDTLPVLAPEGAIIPLDGDASPRNGCKNPTHLEIMVVIGKDGEFTIIEDPTDDAGAVTSNSKGAANREITLSYKQSEGRLSISKSSKQWLIKFLSVNDIPNDLQVSVNGVKTDCSVKVQTDTPGLLVNVPASGDGEESDIVISLGADPQLSVLPVAERLTEWLMSVQMKFDLKDKIRAVALDGNAAPASRIGGLLALGLDNAVLGPVVEMLTADSRAPNRA